jgi:hypothetical protein
LSSDFIRRAFDFRATFPWSSESLHRVIWQRKCFSAILFKGCLKELIKGSIICLRLLAGSGSVGEGLALIDPLTRGLSTSTSLTCTPGILPLAISVVAQKGGKKEGELVLLIKQWILSNSGERSQADLLYSYAVGVSSSVPGFGSHGPSGGH